MIVRLATHRNWITVIDIEHHPRPVTTGWHGERHGRPLRNLESLRRGQHPQDIPARQLNACMLNGRPLGLDLHSAIS